MTQTNDWQDELYLTTDPPEILSITTAFNATVWAASGAIIGSYLQLPTLQGSEVNLSGLGAAAGLATYMGLVFSNKTSIPEEVKQATKYTELAFEELKWVFKDFGYGVSAEDIANLAAKYFPGGTKNVSKDIQAFIDKYGVAPWVAIGRYKQEHPDDPFFYNFDEWLNETYLLSRGLNEQQALDFYKYVLKRTLVPPFGPIEFKAWRDRDLVDRWSEFKHLGWPGNNFWNWLKEYYNKN